MAIKLKHIHYPVWYMLILFKKIIDNPINSSISLHGSMDFRGVRMKLLLMKTSPARGRLSGTLVKLSLQRGGT